MHRSSVSEHLVSKAKQSSVLIVVVIMLFGEYS